MASNPDLDNGKCLEAFSYATKGNWREARENADLEYADLLEECAY